MRLLTLHNPITTRDSSDTLFPITGPLGQGVYCVRYPESPADRNTQPYRKLRNHLRDIVADAVELAQHDYEGLLVEYEGDFEELDGLIVIRSVAALHKDDAWVMIIAYEEDQILGVNAALAPELWLEFGGWGTGPAWTEAYRTGLKKLANYARSCLLRTDNPHLPTSVFGLLNELESWKWNDATTPRQRGLIEMVQVLLEQFRHHPEQLAAVFERISADPDKYVENGKAWK